MSAPPSNPPPIHATSVAIDGVAVLLLGQSGAGKSDLALRLIDRGATLISDDYTLVRADGGSLFASAPPRIAGQMEVRGVGILPFPVLAAVPIALACDLDVAPDRLPEGFAERAIAGVMIPHLAVKALEASAPIKVELALRVVRSAVVA